MKKKKFSKTKVVPRFRFLGPLCAPAEASSILCALASLLRAFRSTSPSGL